MRPHWIEAGVLLAAHGHAAAAPSVFLHPFTRILRMADFPPFALAERLDGVTKPRVFASAERLAVHIEGRRHGQAIELVDVEDIEVPGQPGLYTGVQIFTLLLDGGRDRCLGYAWLGGRGRERLEPALRAVRRDIGRRAVA